MKPRTVLDLFSGVGGFSLGLEWTGGYQTVGFCEACPKARKILAKRWPGVPIFEDVRTLTKETIDDDCGTIDVLCGGFPCQDISLAGKGEGLEGKRSGLWFEMLRIIDATRPRYVIAENVSALRSRGLDRVLGSLAEIGYDAEWHCIPASAVGAPHRRDRVWIIAFPNADHPGCVEQRRPEPVLAELPAVKCGGWWSSEPDVGRVAHGVPSRVDRLRGLGNAVVPQAAEFVGRQIIAFDEAYQ